MSRRFIKDDVIRAITSNPSWDFGGYSFFRSIVKYAGCIPSTNGYGAWNALCMVIALLKNKLNQEAI
jgi:hypothetical protein